MQKPFLGVGWGFPVALTASGEPAIAQYEESVRQSIWIVLSTSPGERLMRPDFGCGIYDLVFEVNSASTAGKITHAIQEALLQFEPRINVLDIQVEPQGSGEVLEITIEYEVRATNNIFNLVYPFYLDRSGNS
jgi:phage baseplate assembly protein W